GSGREVGAEAVGCAPSHEDPDAEGLAAGVLERLDLPLAHADRELGPLGDQQIGRIRPGRTRLLQQIQSQIAVVHHPLILTWVFGTAEDAEKAETAEQVGGRLGALQPQRRRRQAVRAPGARRRSLHYRGRQRDRRARARSLLTLLKAQGPSVRAEGAL